MTKQTLTQLEQHDLFLRRHIGPDSSQQQEMLNYVGAESPSLQKLHWYGLLRYPSA